MTYIFTNQNSVATIINRQQQRLKRDLCNVVQQLATHTKYPHISRQDKRIVEHNRLRATQEQSLQKDTEKAERLANRIGKILDRLLAEFIEIKHILNSYHYASTVGSDSGSDVGDLSTASDTRKAWKMRLINKVTNVYHMVDSQVLGDYTLLHQPESSYAVTSSGADASTMVLNKCPTVFRPVFHYYTPSSDCLVIPKEAGGHSGDPTSYDMVSTTITYTGFVAGNYNGEENIRSSVLGYKTGSVPNPDLHKQPPQSFDHFQVTNKDLEIRQLWRLFVGSSDGETVHVGAWWSFLVANTLHAYQQNSSITRDGLKTYFETEISLPATMVEKLDQVVISRTSSADNSVITHLHNLIVNSDSSIDHELYLYWDGLLNTAPTQTETMLREALSHAPTIQHIEDESDMQLFSRIVCSVTNDIRACQVNNERELSVIRYVRNVSQANQAYYQDAVTDLVAVDEKQLRRQYSVGEHTCAKLNQLYQDVRHDKGNFFGTSRFK